jgi:hypothetical protein
MGIAQAVAGALLGLMFLFASLTFLMKLGPMPPPPPADSPVGMFMGATFASGFMTFVKVLETLGGLLVALPRTRALGLLILVPIVLNIVAFHVFIAGGGLLNPMLLAILVLTVFLAWSHRRGVAVLMKTA